MLCFSFISASWFVCSLICWRWIDWRGSWWICLCCRIRPLIFQIQWIWVRMLWPESTGSTALRKHWMGWGLLALSFWSSLQSFLTKKTLHWNGTKLGCFIGIGHVNATENHGCDFKGLKEMNEKQKKMECLIWVLLYWHAWWFCGTCYVNTRIDNGCDIKRQNGQKKENNYFIIILNRL